MNNNQKFLRGSWILFLFLACIACGSGGGEETLPPTNSNQNLSENTATVLKGIYLFSVPDTVGGAHFSISGADTVGDMSGFTIKLGMGAKKCESNGNVVPDCRLTLEGPLGGTLVANLGISFSRLENLAKSGTAFYEFVFERYKMPAGSCLINGAEPVYEISGQLYCELNFSHIFSEPESTIVRQVRGFCSTDRNVEKALTFNLDSKYHYISYQKNHNVDSTSPRGPGLISLGVFESLGHTYESSTMIFDNKDTYNHVRGDPNFNGCVTFWE